MKKIFLLLPICIFLHSCESGATSYRKKVEKEAEESAKKTELYKKCLDAEIAFMEAGLSEKEAAKSVDENMKWCHCVDSLKINK